MGGGGWGVGYRTTRSPIGLIFTTSHILRVLSPNMRPISAQNPSILDILARWVLSKAALGSATDRSTPWVAVFFWGGGGHKVPNWVDIPIFPQNPSMVGIFARPDLIQAARGAANVLLLAGHGDPP